MLRSPNPRAHIGRPYRHTTSGLVPSVVLVFVAFAYKEESADEKLAPSSSTTVPPSDGPEIGEMEYNAGGS